MLHSLNILCRRCQTEKAKWSCTFLDSNRQFEQWNLWGLHHTLHV